MHTTAALLLGEWQDALLEDYRRLLEGLVPDRTYWKHNDPRHSDCDRQNAAAHLRTLFLGSSVSLPVRDGRVERGKWQSIIFVELDGPRSRSVGIDVRTMG
jgi:secondary thiamine-phosphate synthase enzyme